MAFLSLVHIIYLHEKGSSNPLGLESSKDTIIFHPYFSVKDRVGFLMYFALSLYLTCFYPYLFSDPENFLNASPLVTPAHIAPEWYFLPIYAILRAIPNKLGGVIALILSVLILGLLPLISKPQKRRAGIKPLVSYLF